MIETVLMVAMLAVAHWGRSGRDGWLVLFGLCVGCVFLIRPVDGVLLGAALIAFRSLHCGTQNTVQVVATQATFNQTPEHRTPIGDGFEVGIVERSRTCEWTILLSDSRVSDPLAIECGFNSVCAKMLFEKLCSQETHQSLAQHAASLTTNGRLSADPESRDSFCDRQCSCRIDLREM